MQEEASREEQQQQQQEEEDDKEQAEEENKEPQQQEDMEVRPSQGPSRPSLLPVRRGFLYHPVQIVPSIDLGPSLLKDLLISAC